MASRRGLLSPAAVAEGNFQFHSCLHDKQDDDFLHHLQCMIEYICIYI